MDNITVLLSTYNGEKYLPEQLKSIFDQRDVNVRLLVRDDGSTDATCAILDSWSRTVNLTWYTGFNLKPAKSFIDLLKNAGESPYYAFSDQDDFWLPEKLSTAINFLEKFENEPALYFCQTQLVDKNLNKIDSVIIQPYITFGEALVYQFVGGCTMVLNSKLRDIVLKHKQDYVTMHDVWIYDLALSVGAKVVFDPIPHIYYRQHGNNVIGQSTSRLKEWRSRLSNYFKGEKNERSNIALELMKGYGDMMPVRNYKIVEDFVKGKDSFSKRMELLFDKRYRCSSKKTYWLFKLAILLNTY